MIRVALALAGLIALGWAPPAARAAGERLAPGLSHLQWRCEVAGQTLSFDELKLESGRGLELRAVRNPGAHPDNRCRDGYGGPDLETWLKAPPREPRGFEVLGATNGTVFRVAGRGYSSNQLLWSKGAGLIAGLRARSGEQFFVADARGGHNVTLKHPPSTARLVASLRARFPTATLILQSNMPLMPVSDPARHWSACPAGNPGDWRCRRLTRTALCARHDGTISLLVSSPALPLELAQGLAPGGACGAQCELLYNLDGGRSSQVAWRAPGGTYELQGGRIETTQPGCSPYRPVDNYLVLGKGKD